MLGRMHKATLCTALLLLLSVAPPVNAVADTAPELTLDQRSSAIHLRSMQPLLEREPLWANIDQDPFGSPEEEPEMYGFEPKSSRKAFIYSLLIPGAGQVYTKSTIIKPILFLGLEAAGIFAYVRFHGKGVDRRDEYEAFADEHWFYDDYIQSLEDEYPSADWRYGDEAKWWDPGQGDSVNLFSEHLDVWIDEEADSARPYKNHTYYENIGKYYQFQYGWEDCEYPNPDSLVFPLRDKYLGMRKAANDEFGKASTAIILTIVNHLASAFDAALSARRYNRQQDQLSSVSVKMRYVMYEGKPVPRLTMTYRY